MAYDNKGPEQPQPKEEVWKTEYWKWGGHDPELLKKEPKYVHAFHVPGLGWFGGFPEEIAKHIVMVMNEKIILDRDP